MRQIYSDGISMYGEPAQLIVLVIGLNYFIFILENKYGECVIKQWPIYTSNSYGAT